MNDKVARVTELLREAADLHHRTYRMFDGADDDWASWYSRWLVELSELPQLLGKKPVLSELTWLLVGLGKQYDEASAGRPWQRWYGEHRRALPGLIPPDR